MMTCSESIPRPMLSITCLTPIPPFSWLAERNSSLVFSGFICNNTFYQIKFRQQTHIEFERKKFPLEKNLKSKKLWIQPLNWNKLPSAQVLLPARRQSQIIFPPIQKVTRNWTCLPGKKNHLKSEQDLLRQSWWDVHSLLILQQGMRRSLFSQLLLSHPACNTSFQRH